jgi:hypothetical protein
VLACSLLLQSQSIAFAHVFEHLGFGEESVGVGTDFLGQMLGTVSTEKLFDYLSGWMLGF